MIAAIWNVHRLWLGSRTGQMLLVVGGGVWLWLWGTGDPTTRILLAALTAAGLLGIQLVITPLALLLRALPPLLPAAHHEEREGHEGREGMRGVRG